MDLAGPCAKPAGRVFIVGLAAVPHPLSHTLYTPSDPANIWTRRQKQTERALHNNLLVRFDIMDHDGSGTFRVDRVMVDGPPSTDDCWELPDIRTSTALLGPASIHDIVVLCAAELKTPDAAKTTCELSSRKWGPEGCVIKRRLSGLEAEALADITSHSAAWSVVGDVFEEGVSLCLDNVTWARVLPHLTSSAWRSRVVHESHRWVTVGGKPDEILQALHG